MCRDCAPRVSGCGRRGRHPTPGLHSHFLLPPPPAIILTQLPRQLDPSALATGQHAARHQGKRPAFCGRLAVLVVAEGGLGISWVDKWGRKWSGVEWSGEGEVHAKGRCSEATAFGHTRNVGLVLYRAYVTALSIFSPVVR